MQCSALFFHQSQNTPTVRRQLKKKQWKAYYQSKPSLKDVRQTLKPTVVVVKQSNHITWCTQFEDGIKYGGDLQQHANMACFQFGKENGVWVFAFITLKAKRACETQWQPLASQHGMMSHDGPSSLACTPCFRNVSPETDTWFTVTKQ